MFLLVIDILLLYVIKDMLFYKRYFFGLVCVCYKYIIVNFNVILFVN